MDVQALLKSKNRCLNQLISLTEDALNTAIASTSVLDAGLSEALPAFDQSRSAIFKAIELVDREITQAVSKVAPNTLPSIHQREELKTMVEEQKTLIESLQALDSRLLEVLSDAIRLGQKELTQQSKQREQLSRFKSQAGVETGEELDQKL